MSTCAIDRLFKHAMTKAMNRLHSVKAGKYINWMRLRPSQHLSSKVTIHGF